MITTENQGFPLTSVLFWGAEQRRKKQEEMKRVLAEQIAEKERQKKEEEERRWADEHFGRMLLGYHQWFLTMHKQVQTTFMYKYKL